MGVLKVPVGLSPLAALSLKLSSRRIQHRAPQPPPPPPKKKNKKNASYAGCWIADSHALPLNFMCSLRKNSLEFSL